MSHPAAGAVAVNLCVEVIEAGQLDNDRRRVMPSLVDQLCDEPGLDVIDLLEHFLIELGLEVQGISGDSPPTQAG